MSAQENGATRETPIGEGAGPSTWMLADLQPEQYAYRSNSSALDAVRHVHKLLCTRHGQGVDADLSGYFDSIPHAQLMRCVARRVKTQRQW